MKKILASLTGALLTPMSTLAYNGTELLTIEMTLANSVIISILLILGIAMGVLAKQEGVRYFGSFITLIIGFILLLSLNYIIGAIIICLGILLFYTDK